MPAEPPAEGGPLRRAVADILFEHPIGPGRLLVAGLLLAGLAVVALAVWPRSAGDLPTHLPFVTVPPSTTGTPAQVVVHVAGAVVQPGLYHRPAGDRVADLLEAAGGVLAEADVDLLNLAERLRDGSRIWVPSVGIPHDPRPDPAAATAMVDPNRASAGQLEVLTGVGPSLAEAIVGHRERYGPFGAVEDLLAVAGIGPAKLAGFRDQVTLHGG